jgi:hypothetical protein
MLTAMIMMSLFYVVLCEAVEEKDAPACCLVSVILFPAPIQWLVGGCDMCQGSFGFVPQTLPCLAGHSGFLGCAIVVLHANMC